MDPREIVAGEAGNRIRDHLNRTARYNPTKSLTTLTGQLAQEYEDRFLVELVQNAYDAHPADTRSGRVHVRLDESAEGGTVLYVANTGNPFTVANFDALTNVAQSSKPPGEGIGNKGVGFRSVLQVCESPEIYSCTSADTSGFDLDGFCFGFASDRQMREMAADESQYQIIKEDFSRYLLPVVANPTDPQLRTLRGLGMVTIVRLPLLTMQAVELARKQVHRLLEPTPPIALFLDRLAAITVEHVESDGELTTAEVNRVVEDVSTSEGGPTLRWVETVGKRFLTTSRLLTAAQLRGVIQEAIDLGELDQSWAAWDADVEVSLAVLSEESEADTDRPSTYTYLPMRVAAPAYAHLNAPFHTKLARLDLNEESVFNSFLIDIAAELSVDTIELLSTRENLDLDLRIRHAAVVDLLCWDENHVSHLDDTLSRRGLDVVDASFIPCRGPDGRIWQSLRGVRVWESAGLHALSAETLEAHAYLVDQSIGSKRIQRLKAFSERHLSHDLDPSDDEIAEWVEKVAGGLQGAAVSKWNSFFNDVAMVFDSRQQSALQRRLILLDDKRKLRRSGPWGADASSSSDPTVFLPPQPVGAARKGSGEEDPELSEVPKNLQRAITFLHGGIKVRAGSGRNLRRTPIGELLRNADLVEPFELEAILSHLQRLLLGSVSDTTHRQALSWVYAQERASRSNIGDLARVGLRVPTDRGWVPASQAAFSREWGTPRAATVAALLKDSVGVSASLQSLEESVILAPSDWPFKLKDTEGFLDFLSRCGVRDGLFPLALRSKTAIRMNGINFSPDVIAGRFGLADYQQWEEDIREKWTGNFVGPQTPYTGEQELWVIPGQDSSHSLSVPAKDKLAAAILESIGDWPEEAWTYTFRRRSQHHLQRPDPQEWPTPAASFVEKASWFPMSNPRNREQRYFVPVRDAWTFDETTTEVAPRFARLAPMDHRRRLAASLGARNRLEKAGLKTWNSPSSAGMRLVELADLVASAEIQEGEVASVRRSVKNSWSDFVHLSDGTLSSDMKLIVSRGSALGVVDPSSTDPPEVYVDNVPPGLASQVLEASGLPILEADYGDGDPVAEALERNEGFKVRRTSMVGANVILDGEELVPASDAGVLLLDVFGHWLVRTLLSIIDLRSTKFGRVTDKVLHDAESRLLRMRLMTGSSIHLTVDGQTIEATGRLAECVHIDDPDNPLLVLNDNEVALPSWRALELLADDIAEVMRQAAVASEIRASALAFQRSVLEWREPSDVEIAKALRCSVDAVTNVLSNLRTSTDHLRSLLVPFVGVLADIGAARRIETETVPDLGELRALLASLIGEDQAAALLASAERAESIEDIWRDLAIELPRLNDVLLSLGRPPLHFAELHRVALSNYINNQRMSILGALRQSFLSQFEGRQNLANYASARDFRDLGPNPDWLHSFEFPTEKMMKEHVDSWLATKGGPSRTVTTLESVDRIREANRTLLDGCLPKIARLVWAWLAKSGSEIPEAWSDVQHVQDALGKSGCLDFVELQELDVLAWLLVLDLWPGGMQATLDASELGVTAADLELASSSKAAKDERRRRRRSQLSFGGRSFDTGTTKELRELIDEVTASASEEFMQTRPRPTKLSPITISGRGGGKGSGAGGAPRSYGGRSKPSPEQTAALGLAGEALAYRWLQRTYPETTPDSWVSANRTFQLGGHPGDDGLGYDFEIARRNETLLFEVKATTSDDCEFDIGESELRAARAARQGRYRIIFVSSVLVPSERRLLVLPNPLEQGSLHLFGQVNKGMRLRFAPTSA